jgi:threonine/homoserine/homoserine lactone efflux protein
MLGATYLIYLGLRALLDKSGFQSPGLGMEKIGMKKIFWQGALTNLLNPKVALFFLAFLPQFIRTGTAHPASQILFMGIWFNIGGTLVNMTVATLFGVFAGKIGRSAKWAAWQKKTTGMLLIALGIKVAFSSK